MNKISDILISKNILIKKIEKFPLEQLKIKKKLLCYIGVDVKSYYVLLFIRDAKTRFLSKDAIYLNDLSKKIEIFQGYTVKKKILINSSQMCSKAKKILTEDGWKI